MTKYKIIKDCDGNILYKKQVYEYEDLRESQINSQRNRDESLVGDWKSSASDHILVRDDMNFSHASSYRRQYRCAHCTFEDRYWYCVKAHLQDVHCINIDINGSGKRCHACGKGYNKLFKAKKYAGWDDDKRRIHHWEVCSKLKQRKESYIAPEGLIYTDSFFDTTQLPLRIRNKISDNIGRKYISNKHVYHECQPEYIDNITTAYRSDIMKEILKHNN